jgi:Xaa-Pro aminopeptidase
MNLFEHSAIFINDGLPTDKAVERYAHRRQVFSASVNHVCVLFAVDKGPGEPNPWVHVPHTIYQDPFFLFLTGINQFPAALVLDQKSNQTLLFLPKKDPSKEFWDGIRFGLEEDETTNQILAKTLGFSKIHHMDELGDVVKSILKATPQPLGLFWNESKTGTILEDSHPHQNKTLLSHLPSTIETVNVCQKSWAVRLPLDGTDLCNAQIANTKTIEAFLLTLKRLHMFSTENEVCGHLNGQILQKSWFGNSFTSIIACGANASVLHYSKNNAPLEPRGLLLMDFGLRWHTMHADVSRTIPVCGRFNPMQALLYQIVLDTQIHVESLVKPGISITELNTQCWAFMNTLLEERFLSKGGIMKRPYDIYPHNMGHFLGMQVHDGDPFREYREEPLQPGFMITNEPGLYGHFKIELDGVLYEESLGIRIEDNLWITPSGCVNLTAACPKTIADIERRLARP